MRDGSAATCWLIVRSCLLGAACLALAGCGGGIGDLSGTVTYNDQPLRVGTVTVAASDGSVKNGPIQDDGTYSIPGIPSGEAKVAVNSPDPRTLKVAQRKKNEPPPPPDTSKWVQISGKYADYKNSGLTTTVKSGKNMYNIELK